MLEATVEGSPLQIVELRKTDGKRDPKLCICRANIKSMKEKLGDRQVCVITIAGASRMGKSFFLGWVVWYLTCLEKGRSNWMELKDPRQPLQGFTFRNGIRKETNGIWCWSKPFIFKNEKGQEIAVLLMDTQGVFDSDTADSEWYSIMGISLLLSSSLVVNLFHNLQEDGLQKFQSFLEFGQTIMESEESKGSPENNKCFQKLLFLIRDWNMPDEFDFGAEGGSGFLKEKLDINKDIPKDHALIRELISKSFKSLDCFLMPAPGSFALKNTFQGSLVEMKADFNTNLKSCIETHFNPMHLESKKVCGSFISGKQWCDYLEKLVEQLEDHPSSSSLLRATVYSRNSSALNEALIQYRKEISSELEGVAYLPEIALTFIHTNSKQRSIHLFQKNSHRGIPDLEIQFQENLISQLEEEFRHISSNNLVNKHLFTIKMLENIKFSIIMYKKQMRNSDSVRDVKALIEMHETVKENVLKWFDQQLLGPPEITDEFQQKLILTLQEEFLKIEEEFGNSKKIKQELELTHMKNRQLQETIDNARTELFNEQEKLYLTLNHKELLQEKLKKENEQRLSAEDNIRKLINEKQKLKRNLQKSNAENEKLEEAKKVVERKLMEESNLSHKLEIELDSLKHKNFLEWMKLFVWCILLILPCILPLLFISEHLNGEIDMRAPVSSFSVAAFDTKEHSHMLRQQIKLNNFLALEQENEAVQLFQKKQEVESTLIPETFNPSSALMPTLYNKTNTYRETTLWFNNVLKSLNYSRFVADENIQQLPQKITSKVGTAKSDPTTQMHEEDKNVRNETSSQTISDYMEWIFKTPLIYRTCPRVTNNIFKSFSYGGERLSQTQTKTSLQTFLPSQERNQTFVAGAEGIFLVIKNLFVAWINLISYK